MLSDRSFDMKKHAPFCPTWREKNPHFTPFKGIYGASGIRYFIALKYRNGKYLQDFLSGFKILERSLWAHHF